MHELTCFACGVRPAAAGALCQPCLPPPPRDVNLGLGQVHSSASLGADGWLADAWGRLHPVSDQAVLGRTSVDVAVFSPGVSRSHAELRRTGRGWELRDLRSRNGTVLEGIVIDGPTAVGSRDLIRLGPVSLRFLEGSPDPAHLEAGGSSTCSILYLPAGESGDGGQRIRLVEPMRGGGGILEVADHHCQLPLLQYELVSLLVERYATDDADEQVRGYVPSAELLANLSWDTANPSPAHLKQLVRRVRRQLSGLGLVVEASRGFGYRVRLAG